MSFVDAICVRFISETTVIYGKGNRLILRAGGTKVVNDIAPYDKIHQISFRRKDDGSVQVAASAGREILFTEIDDNQFRQSMSFKLSDWISSIKVLDDGLVACLTAHNIAVLLELACNELVIREKLLCEANATLYCSHISGSRWSDLVFFGGTALGELVVWRKHQTLPKILLRQFLHNGVIFSIDYNRSEGFLVTSSDDRSIKVFSVTSDLSSFQIDEKKQLFGHTARVFVTKIINFEGTKFVTAGEDSNICVWNDDGNLLSKRNVSSSGTLWDFDYDEISQTIVTSSSTGTLNRFDLREILFEDHRLENFSAKAHAAKLNFLENGNLVVLDSKMKLHLRKGHNWHEVEQPETDEKFVAMTVLRNRLFIAGKQSISVFDFDETRNFVEMIQVAEFLPANLSLGYLRAIHATTIDEVCVSDLKGLCLVFNINQKKLLNAFQIPRSFEPWTTAVAKVNGSWLIADRVGNLFLYGNDPELPCLPTQKIWRLHGQLGVTTISVGDNGFIRTTGSDGNIKTLFIDHATSPPTLQVHRSEKTSVNWIEKVFKWAGKEFLLGFNDNYFGIYQNRQIIHEHRCGGRHRHWDVTYDANTNLVNLVYIQRKQLHSVQFKLSDFAFDADDMAWHTKDCNALAVFSDLLITGGEDTLLKITRVEELNGQLQMREVATLNSHNSSIKDFSVAQDGDDLLIFSSGGRSQIAVNRLIKMSHVKEEVNFHYGATKGFVPMTSTFDPEMRFTSLHFDESTRNLFVACSDGFIRVFKCKRDDEGSLRLELSVEHFYGLCVLKVHVIERDVFVSMATDGFICFWRHDESSKALELIDRLKHNQSGINCYDIYKSGEGRSCVIGTSGDDTGIFVTEFSLADGRIAFGQTISSHEIHTAQVTGLKFSTKDTFYTTSVDQTVCQLQLTPTTIELVARKFTCISDVKGFELLKDKQIVVFGAGLEVLTSF